MSDDFCLVQPRSSLGQKIWILSLGGTWTRGQEWRCLTKLDVIADRVAVRDIWYALVSKYFLGRWKIWRCSEQGMYLTRISPLVLILLLKEFKGSVVFLGTHTDRTDSALIGPCCSWEKVCSPCYSSTSTWPLPILMDFGYIDDLWVYLLFIFLIKMATNMD